MSPQSLWVKGKNVFLSLNRAITREHGIYLLLLLLLPTQFGKHFWPEYAHILGFRVDYLSPTLYVTDILIALLFLHWIVRIRAWRKPTHPTTLPFVLIFLFLLLTILPAYSVSAGLYSLLKFAELLFFGWYTATQLTPLLFRRLLPYTFSLTTIGCGLLSLLQVKNNGSLGGPLYFFGERTISSLTPGAATAVINGEVYLRPYATFSHPNVLAGFLLIAMTLLLFRRDAFDTPFQQGILFTSLILGTAGLLVTLSRIPIVLWIVVLALYLFPILRTKRDLLRGRMYIFLSSIAVGGICFLIVMTPLVGRFLGTHGGEESFLVRADLNRGAVAAIRSHPVIGVGLGNSLFTTSAMRDVKLPLFFTVQPVHNIFLLVAVETGLLGLFVLLWFIAGSFHRAGMTGRVLLLIVCILGLFDHYFLTLQQGQLLFAFLFGYCWAEKRFR